MYMKPETQIKIQTICDRNNFILQDITFKGHYSYIHFYNSDKELLTRRKDHFFEQYGADLIERRGSKYTTELLKSDLRINPTVEILGEFTNIDTKLLCKCKKCGNKWMVTPNKLIQGRACPECKGDVAKQKFTKTDTAFKQELIDKNIPYINLDPYINSRTNIRFLCKDCGYIFVATPSNIIRKVVGCTNCAASLGEQKILQALRELNISFETQKTFKNCKDKGYLRFDFYLQDYNVCIEYQGEQHYKPIAFRKEDYGKELELFSNLQERDKKKREFCKNNKIKLITISYENKDNINTTFILNLLSK